MDEHKPPTDAELDEWEVKGCYDDNGPTLHELRLVNEVRRLRAKLATYHEIVVSMYGSDKAVQELFDSRAKDD